MPHDVIEDQVTDFGEGVKSDIKLFAFILQSCVKQMDDVHAYLLGEDNHVYGVCLDMGENAFKIVFFPPDFPQFVHMMRAKDVQKILSWLQTIDTVFLSPSHVLRSPRETTADVFLH